MKHKHSTVTNCDLWPESTVDTKHLVSFCRVWVYTVCMLHIQIIEAHLSVLFYFECGCISSRFLSGHGGRRQSWNCVIVCQRFCFWHAQGEHIYRIEKASATWLLQKICNVCIFERSGFFMYGWIDPLHLQKKHPNLNRGGFFRWQMEMNTHCGARLVLAPLQKCHDVCIIHLPSSQFFLCPFVSSLLNINMYQLAGISFLLQTTLRTFSPQWPLILSCKTWCRCYMEYWANPV